MVANTVIIKAITNGKKFVICNLTLQLGHKPDCDNDELSFIKSFALNFSEQLGQQNNFFILYAS